MGWRGIPTRTCELQAFTNMASIQLSNVLVDRTATDAAGGGLLGWTFIFGAARSGTTWLAKLLDSCPEVLYSHEPFTKGGGLAYHRAVHALASGNLDAVPQRAEIARELIASRRVFARPPFFWKQFQPRTFSLMRLGWYLGRVTGWNFLRAGQIRGPVHLVVKEGLTPNSLPLAERLGARAIVLFRHPCAVVNSRLRGERCGAMEPIDRQSLLQGSESLGLGFSPREIMAMKEDEALALDWLLTYLPVVQLAEDCPPKVQWVTYERLVERSGEVLAGLFAGCGLPMTRQTLRFLARSSETHPGGLRMLLGRRARYFGVERRAEEPAHVWRSELSRESIQRILAVAERFPLARYWPPSEASEVEKESVDKESALPRLLAET